MRSTRDVTTLRVRCALTLALGYCGLGLLAASPALAQTRTYYPGREPARAAAPAAAQPSGPANTRGDWMQRALGRPTVRSPRPGEFVPLPQMARGAAGGHRAGPHTAHRPAELAHRAPRSHVQAASYDPRSHYASDSYAGDGYARGDHGYGYDDPRYGAAANRSAQVPHAGHAGRSGSSTGSGFVRHASFGPGGCCGGHGGGALSPMIHRGGDYGWEHEGDVYSDSYGGEYGGEWESGDWGSGGWGSGGWEGGGWYDDGWGGGGGGCSSCGFEHMGACGGCRWHPLEAFSVELGAHGFKGPADYGMNGNFGLHEGINWGGPLWQGMGIGYQIGVAGVHSNFDGDNVANFSGNNLTLGRSGSRDQFFLTAGIFHRALAGGPLQWGVVWDYLHDNYYVDMQLSMVRAELSFVGYYGNELGFWTAASTRDDNGTFNGIDSGGNALPLTANWDANDLYSIFFRRRFATDAEGRLWGGFTHRGDGLVGADFRVPLSSRWALGGNFHYLSPNDSSGGDKVEESWAVACNLIWYPGRTARSVTRSPWRPLMNVADNSTFFVNSRLTNQ